MKKTIMVAGLLALCICGSAQAGPAECSSYLAELGNGNGAVIIHTWAADYDKDAGFTNVGTSIAGAITKSCNSSYDGGPSVCGVAVTGVVLQGREGECWE